MDQMLFLVPDSPGLYRLFSIQNDIARRDDCPRNTFTARSTYTSALRGASPLDRQAHDYDDSVASHLEPSSIHLQGLRWIGGVDVSYRNSGDEGDAVAALVVLEYPSLKEARPFRHGSKGHCSDLARPQDIAPSPHHPPICPRIPRYGRAGIYSRRVRPGHDDSSSRKTTRDLC